MSTDDYPQPSTALQRRVLENDQLVRVGRIGWAAKGVIYLLVGALGISVALGRGSSDDGEASKSGALATIAERPLGGAMLLAVGVGLVLYALWRLVSAALPGDNDAETWVNRAAYVGSAAVYAALAWTAFTVGASSPGGGESGEQQASGGGDSIESVSRWVLERSGGRWVLGIGALAALAAAGALIYKGWQRSFLTEIDMAAAEPAERTLIVRTGVLGWIGRGLTVGFIAIFVLQAAIGADPDDAKGLDSAMRETADTGWGAALVMIAALCIIAYGVFCIVSARHRRIVGP